MAGDALGQPADRPADVVHRPELAGTAQRLAHGGHACRPGERLDQQVDRALGNRPGGAGLLRARGTGRVLGVAGKPGGDGVHVRGKPGAGRAPRRHRLDQQLAQPVDAGAGDGRGGEYLDIAEVLGVKQPAEVGDAVLRLPGGQPVGLVQDHRDDLGMAGQRHQVPAVHSGVGVFLRIEYPHHQVREPDHAVDLAGVTGHHRIVVRQIQQDQAGHCILAPVQRAGPGITMPALDSRANPAANPILPLPRRRRADPW